MATASPRLAAPPISALGATIDFRPVTEADFSLLAVWVSAPHVARWWDGLEERLDKIRQAMTEPSTRPFVILMDGRPIGYIQTYDVHGEDDHPYQDQPAGTFGLDILIGEADLVGKGLGPRVINEFVRRLFAEGVRRVVIDPDPDNRQAIRAYEKAGFREFDRRTTIYGPALMMARDVDLTTRE